MTRLCASVHVQIKPGTREPDGKKKKRCVHVLIIQIFLRDVGVEREGLSAR